MAATSSARTDRGTSPGQPCLVLEDVAKTFTMHLRDGAKLPVVRNVSFAVSAGECVALGGPSGAGKSSILKMIYGNYRIDAGQIRIRHGADWIDLADARPRTMLAVRQSTLGYVSQFLRSIPRVGAMDIVTDAADPTRVGDDVARARASSLLGRLNVPERLWQLPPGTFSGGEQQRVNIAAGFAARRPVLLLDEPTASLDSANRDVVIDLIAESKNAGAAIVGIFHDADVRNRVADRVIDVTHFAA